MTIRRISPILLTMKLTKWHKLNRRSKEYLSGVASGRVHLSNDPLCKANLAKIQTGILASDRPLVQAYWRGYKDGMNGTKEFYFTYIPCE